MKTYFLLAWRNLWRNKRRTLIASASIFFAVIFALLMRSMQEGSYDYMVDASVSMYTGYIQVHAKNIDAEAINVLRLLRQRFLHAKRK